MTDAPVVWLVWRFHFGRPEFLCVCKSEKAARKAIAKAKTPGWTCSPIAVNAAGATSGKGWAS